MAKKQKNTICLKKEKQYYYEKKYRETLSFIEVLELRVFLQSEPHLKKHKDFTKIEYVNNTNIKFLP